MPIPWRLGAMVIFLPKPICFLCIPIPAFAGNLLSLRKFLQGYVLTEPAAIVASIFAEEETERYESSGLFSPDVEAKIVDPDAGRVLGVDQTGMASSGSRVLP
ncbi:AMP-dependent synthetase/ligase protein [Raphanus sativus]|nr:AMP-dependent synthetase/ligase protein [Raphanus sativus]